MDDVKHSPMPEGATLNISSNEVELPPDFVDEQDLVEASSTERPQFKSAPGAFMTPEKFMKALKHMVDTDQLTPEQARQMRTQFGVTQAYFTGKKVSREHKNAKKKIATESRRKNRVNGSTKGQKRTSHQGRGD